MKKIENGIYLSDQALYLVYDNMIIAKMLYGSTWFKFKNEYFAMYGNKIGEITEEGKTKVLDIYPNCNPW